uniref:Uncharacterized protein n=1 Tax=Glossina pallidipes TaxID=7398 RepID=A0A1B0A3P6_GLOPL
MNKNFTCTLATEITTSESSAKVTQLISLMTSVAKFVEDIGEQLEFLLFSLNEETERLLYVQKHVLGELQFQLFDLIPSPVCTSSSVTASSFTSHPVAWRHVVGLEERLEFCKNCHDSMVGGGAGGKVGNGFDFRHKGFFALMDVLRASNNYEMVELLRDINIIMKVLSSKDLDD